MTKTNVTQNPPPIKSLLTRYSIVIPIKLATTATIRILA